MWKLRETKSNLQDIIELNMVFPPLNSASEISGKGCSLKTCAIISRVTMSEIVFLQFQDNTTKDSQRILVTYQIWAHTALLRTQSSLCRKGKCQLLSDFWWVRPLIMIKSDSFPGFPSESHTSAILPQRVRQHNLRFLCGVQLTHNRCSIQRIICSFPVCSQIITILSCSPSCLQLALLAGL